MSRRKAFYAFAALATAGVVVAGLVLAAHHIYGWRWASGGPPPLARLDTGDLQELKDAFNAAGDRTRLLALLSPT